MLLAVVDGLLSALPAVVEAGLLAIIKLAEGLSQALPTLIPTIVDMVGKIVLMILENLPQLINAALMLILALGQGLIAALPVLIPYIPQIIEAIFETIILALPLILTAAIELINTLGLGLIQSLPLLLVSAYQVLQSLATYLYSQGPKMLVNIGKALVDGIWRGIKNNWEALKDGFMSLVNDLVASIKNALLMKSPSRIGEDIGSNLTQSLGSGAEKAAPDVRQQFARMARSLTNNLQMSLTPSVNTGSLQFAAAGAGGVSIGDIYVDARGATNPKAVGEAVSTSVLEKLRSLGGA